MAKAEMGMGGHETPRVEDNLQRDALEKEGGSHLYEKPLESIGDGAANVNFGEHKNASIFGPTIEVGGVTYLITKKINMSWIATENQMDYASSYRSKCKVFDMSNGRIASDEEKEKALAEFYEKVAKNKEITKARKKRASELSKGDRLLASILLENMNYRNGDADSQPLPVDGIDFYLINGNASHNFYLGTKDGKLYHLSYSPDSEELDEKKPTEVTKGTEVYLGSGSFLKAN